MLNIKNAIESVEPLNQEEEPNYDNIQSTDELIETQPEYTPSTELETVQETPKNELEANLDGNVGGGGNENELEANLNGNVGGDGNENEVEDNMDENVGGDGNENEIQNIWLNSVSLEKVNVITEENLESNLVNSKKGDNCDVDMGKSMDEGKETNLDGVLKEGDIDISKRDKESTFSQILTKMKNKKQQTMGNTSIIIGGYEQVTHGPQKGVKKRSIIDFTPPSFRLLSQDDETDELSKDAEMDDVSANITIFNLYDLFMFW
ncbi:hypothetical protein Tco_1281445 [Tanacetum coccineum]